uniref:Putative ovule protein n=1 Tax=Solanum chacoense TaxID=4108 RepID=A0A0V0I2E3_SOLCH
MIWQITSNSNIIQSAAGSRLHLSFADDLLMFARGDSISIHMLHDKFNVFTTASGLQANLSKSVMYFGGVSSMVQRQIQQDLGYSFGVLPFRYLGVPLATKKLSIAQWQPLMDRIVAKISSWTAKKLSYARRIQLVRTVIFGVQAYWAQIFVLPAKVMKIIQAYCRSYIWSGANVITKKALVSLGQDVYTKIYWRA